MQPDLPKHISLDTQIRGKNFHGYICLKGETLSLDLTEFKKGDIYMSEITNNRLQKQNRRFLIFKTIEELFEELKSNNKLYISDQNFLIVPVEIIYKNKLIELNIQVMLIQRKYNSQAEKMQKLFQEIEKISQSKQKIKQQRQKILREKHQLIKFKGDQSNKNYKAFQLSNNGLVVKMIQFDKFIIFNHFEPIPKQGVYYFKVKIIKTKAREIILGVCSSNIKERVNREAFQSLQYMGFYLTNGYLYKNANYSTVIQQPKITQGSVIKIQADMNKGVISWYLLKEGRFYSTQIAQQLRNLMIHPFISLYHQGDTVEILQQ